MQCNFVRGVARWIRLQTVIRSKPEILLRGDIYKLHVVIIIIIVIIIAIVTLSANHSGHAI
jgi:hypothetical protein